MKIKFLAIASAVLLAIGFSLAAGAGTIADGDSDLVPNVYDNCSERANGPASASNQVDTDDPDDGFGDSCDCDYNNDGTVLGDDILALFGVFNTASTLHDNIPDGTVLGDDVLFCFGQFNGPAGPGATAI